MSDCSDIELETTISTMKMFGNFEPELIKEWENRSDRLKEIGH